MHFPKFWARSDRSDFVAWGWSDQSIEDAREKANKSAANIERRITAGQELPRGYGYANAPLRERIIQDISTPDGRQLAVITENAYGCSVLNTEHIMFVDIDFEEAMTTKPTKPVSFLGRIFGKGSNIEAPVAPVETPEKLALKRIENWSKMLTGRTCRVYRTFAGLRVMVTSDLYTPDGSEAEKVFRELGCDPLYQSLCRNQQSFRARLTPKPWRIGLMKPKHRWPFLNEAEQRSYLEWQDLYQHRCDAYAVCKLLTVFGPESQELPEITLVRELHDALSKAHSDLPLA